MEKVPTLDIFKRTRSSLPKNQNKNIGNTHHTAHDGWKGSKYYYVEALNVLERTKRLNGMDNSYQSSVNLQKFTKNNVNDGKDISNHDKSMNQTICHPHNKNQINFNYQNTQIARPSLQNAANFQEVQRFQPQIVIQPSTRQQHPIHIQQPQHHQPHLLSGRPQTPQNVNQFQRQQPPRPLNRPQSSMNLHSQINRNQGTSPFDPYNQNPEPHKTSPNYQTPPQQDNLRHSTAKFLHLNPKKQFTFREDDEQWSASDKQNQHHRRKVNTFGFDATYLLEIRAHEQKLPAFHSLLDTRQHLQETQQQEILLSELIQMKEHDIAEGERFISELDNILRRFTPNHEKEAESMKNSRRSLFGRIN